LTYYQKKILYVVLFIIIVSGTYASAAGNDCDMAQNYFWQGQMGGEREQALQYYLEAVELCPGFIRPYELIGNYYRSQDDDLQAISYFKKAAQLGSVNFKLYYLLGLLYYKQNEYAQALFYVNKSLGFNDTYEKAIELRQKLGRIQDIQGPILTMFEPLANQLNRVAHFYQTLTFRGHAKDKSDITSLNIGGVDVEVQPDGRFLADIPLKPGLNRIKIESVDTFGNRTFQEISVQRATTIADATIYRKSFAVIIGINDYDKWPRLDSAVFDAKAVQSIFEQTGFNEVTLIINKEATQRRILTELYSELPKKVARDDRIVFYFAGHGTTMKADGKPPTGYIIPVESGLTDVPATAVSMGQIRDICSHINAKHIIFVMDCCYAGQILEQGATNENINAGKLEGSTYKRVIQIITAGAKDQMALEGEKHGLFTEFFLNSLQGDADLNSDKVVTGLEIGKYIPPIVAKLTNQAQTPIFAHIEGQGDILFFLKQNTMKQRLSDPDQ
jgi:hypothetical protein